MKVFTKKLFVAVVACLILSIAITGAYATEDSEIPTLFETEQFIKENPFNSSTNNEAWHLIGPNSILNSEKTYPILLKNSTDKDSFYYVAGSNNIESPTLFEGLVDFLQNDFAIEYEVKYNRESEGHVSVTIAYNYKYYIDAYISGDGTGDICIVTPDETVSVLHSDSIISAENSDALIEAIYGKGKSVRFADTIMVTIRVSVDENNMPKKVYMYLNGCLVGETNDSFEENVAALTPEYKLGEDSEFPSDKLGNIVALRATAGVDCSVNSLYVYSVENENYTPDSNVLKYYASHYGNASYKPEENPDEDITTEENTTESVSQETTLAETEVVTEESEIESSIEDEETTTEEQTTRKKTNRDDDEDDYYIDVISTLCIVFGVSGGALIIIAIVILKLRTKKK